MTKQRNSRPSLLSFPRAITKSLSYRPAVYLSQRRSHGHRHFRNVFRVPGVSRSQNTVQSPLIDGIYVHGVAHQVPVLLRS